MNKKISSILTAGVLLASSFALASCSDSQEIVNSPMPFVEAGESPAEDIASVVYLAQVAGIFVSDADAIDAAIYVCSSLETVDEANTLVIEASVGGLFGTPEEGGTVIGAAVATFCPEMQDEAVAAFERLEIAAESLDPV